MLLSLCMAAAMSAPQDGFVTVPTSLMSELGQVLPESSNAGASFVSSSYSPNLVISAAANVRVIFVWEGAGYRNSLGYFTYREEASGDVTILDSNLLIADASFPGAGTAQTGDAYDLRNADGSLREFQAGDRIGFFVVADGWNREPRIQSWSPSTTGIPGASPAENVGIGRGCYTTLDRLNPERLTGAIDASRHVAMLRFPGINGFLDGDEFLVTGFEDLNRTMNSDEDFNDLVFVVTANPIEALDDTVVLEYQPGDPDGDGVSGTDDHFPEDPERAFVTVTPANGVNVYAVEDQYPGLGDADFNDVVLATQFEVVTNAAGAVKDVMVTAHLVARGAGYDHSVGLHLPGLPDGVTGVLETERILSGDVDTHEPASTVPLTGMMASGRRFDLFASTRTALPAIAGATFTNTQFEGIDRSAASVRARMTFDGAVSAAELGQPPYDLFVGVLQGEELWDIHLPGVSGFADRPASLPTEEGAQAFIENGRPWMLEIPTSWRFPREQVRIWNAYPGYSSWASSGGSANADWYESPSATPGFVGINLSEYVPHRTWIAQIPR